MHPICNSWVHWIFFYRIMQYLKKLTTKYTKLKKKSKLSRKRLEMEWGERGKRENVHVSPKIRTIKSVFNEKQQKAFCLVLANDVMLLQTWAELTWWESVKNITFMSCDMKTVFSELLKTVGPLSKAASNLSWPITLWKSSVQKTDWKIGHNV